MTQRLSPHFVDPSSGGRCFGETDPGPDPRHHTVAREPRDACRSRPARRRRAPPLVPSRFQGGRSLEASLRGGRIRRATTDRPPGGFLDRPTPSVAVPHHRKAPVPMPMIRTGFPSRTRATTPMSTDFLRSVSRRRRPAARVQTLTWTNTILSIPFRSVRRSLWMTSWLGCADAWAAARTTRGASRASSGRIGTSTRRISPRC